MERNVYGEPVSNARWRLMLKALKNRQEIIAAGLSRRDLFKMGLLTRAGMLAPIAGLSAQVATDSSRCFHDCGNQCASPATTPFVMQLPIMPVKQPVASLNPAPTVAPNTAAGEGRTRNHQAFTIKPPQVFYQVTQQPGLANMSPQLPLQPIWGFDGISPGPTYHQTYGQPILVRNVNNLPSNNGGFGINSVSTHLHNNHTPSESDGFPCDFFAQNQFYDQHYPGVLAGFASDHQPNGDINESLSTLWYHDHRVDFTAQNTYKGLAGFFLLFNQFDTGDETTGFHLPSGEFDIPMLFADRCFDPTSHLLTFDLFNLDGILGDKFLVNGVIQPVLHVHPRRYRFRWLDSGPSRFYQIYVTDLNNLSANNQFWQISNDGNLLPSPVQVPAVELGVAERADVIIDFSAFAGRTIYLENRLEQTNGRGPTGNLLSAGQGNLLLQIVVDLPTVADNSVNPATGPHFYNLPDTTAAPRVTRNFDFNVTRDGQWTINDQFMDCNTTRFTVQQNSVEKWVLTNNGFGDPRWTHPIHIHFEEFQILQGAPGLIGSGDSRYYYQNENQSTLTNLSRKDVVRILPRQQVTLFFRFRDFLGRYPMHCHNVVHEDHAMMLRWDLATTGDTNQRP
jgi:FtsP/CotA-like multicopper oxidase with cupredoxin domain